MAGGRRAGGGGFRAWRERAERLRLDLAALAIGLGDRRMPWAPRLLAVLVLAYALSPIDLIPDFIPVFGQLDDLILVPLGIWLLLRLVPPELMAQWRIEAAVGARRGWRGLVVAGTVAVLAIWTALGYLGALWLGLLRP